MQILTKRSKEDNQITGIVKLEPSDNPTDCGLFTIDALDQFVSELKKHHQLHDVVSLKSVFRENSFALIAVPDGNEDGEGVIIQGSECTIEGKD